MLPSISGIQSIIDQMKNVASSIQSPIGGITSGIDPGKITSSANGVSSAGGFAGEFMKAMKDVSASQQIADGKMQDFVLGKPGASLSDVMIDSQKALIGFQSAVQFRNKVVQAYQTISSMPV